MTLWSVLVLIIIDRMLVCVQSRFNFQSYVKISYKQKFVNKLRLDRCLLI